MEGLPLAQAEGTEGSIDRLPVGGQRLGGGKDSWRCPPSPVGGRLEVEGDEELTSLNWLHEGKNLLGGMRLAGVSSVDPLPARDKPPLNCPLSVAVEDTSWRHLPVKEIYKWILQQYPCLKRTPGDWKKSMRHNRSVRRAVEHGREMLPRPLSFSSTFVYPSAIGCYCSEFGLMSCLIGLMAVGKKLFLNLDAPDFTFLYLLPDGNGEISVWPGWCGSLMPLEAFLRQRLAEKALGKGSFWSIDAESVSGLLQAIRKRSSRLCSPSLSTTDLQNPSYNQRTDGPGQDQLPVSGLDHSSRSALLPDATDATSSAAHGQTNSCKPASRPVWAHVCLARRPASVSNGDHNYSLARGGGKRRFPVAEPDRTVCAEAGGDDGSEGFVSGGESGTEDEGAEDSLADSGYVPLGTRTPSPAGSGPRLEGWEALGIDEELREVAGSLLNLAGIHR